MVPFCTKKRTGPGAATHDSSSLCTSKDGLRCGSKLHLSRHIDSRDLVMVMVRSRQTAQLTRLLAVQDAALQGKKNAFECGADLRETGRIQLFTPFKASSKRLTGAVEPPGLFPSTTCKLHEETLSFDVKDARSSNLLLVDFLQEFEVLAALTRRLAHDTGLRTQECAVRSDEARKAYRDAELISLLSGDADDLTCAREYTSVAKHTD